MHENFFKQIVLTSGMDKNEFIFLYFDPKDEDLW